MKILIYSICISRLFVKQAIQHTRNHPHIQEDRIHSLPLMSGLQDRKSAFVLYIFPARRTGIATFKKTNQFCLHLA